MAETLVDSYSEAYMTTNALGVCPTCSYKREGQGFTGDGKKLTSCKFYLTRQDVLNDNCKAYLYAHTGTFGSNGTPTGSVLATSNPVDATTLTLTPTYSLITFLFDGTYTLENGTKYFITCDYLGSTSYIRIGINNTTSPPEGVGNYARYNGSVWQGIAYPMCFYVYGEAGPATSILKVAGVFQANIKTVYPIALASIKKLSGVSNS